MRLAALLRLACLPAVTVPMALLACHTPEPTSRRPLQYYAPPGHPTTTPVEASPTPVGGSVSKVAPEPSGKCVFGEGQLFSSSAPWNQPVLAQPVAPDSGAVISYLDREHVSQHRFRTDFAFVVQQAAPDVPKRAFTPTEDHYAPDCDTMPVPVPPKGRIEGEQGYTCLGDGDCHLLVHVPETCQLYEMWRANITASGFFGGCLVRWDTRMHFDSAGRGQDCTSADASGLPITPLLFTATDLVKGSINHAIRLILPNKFIRKHVYVAPATHSTGPTSGPDDAPPYGARFRLKSKFDTSSLSKGAQVVATALKAYGMIIVDGGVVSFTATSDQETKAKWSDTNFGPRSLEGLKWTDFEMVASSPPRQWQGDCSRAQLSE